MSDTTSHRKPPIKCIPCRVSYRGHRYQIDSNGAVRNITAYIDLEADKGLPRRAPEAFKFTDVTAIVPEER